MPGNVSPAAHRPDQGRHPDGQDIRDIVAGAEHDIVDAIDERDLQATMKALRQIKAKLLAMLGGERGEGEAGASP